MAAVTDPISDMLTRIRNAYQAMHKDVRVPRSKAKEAMAVIMQEQGYITGYTVGERDIDIELKYFKGKPVVTGLKRISKPGRRIYVKAEEIPSVQNGLGICILTTSSGIMDGIAAKSKNVGGELLCEIW